MNLDIETGDECVVRLASAATMEEIADARELVTEVLHGALEVQAKLLNLRGRWESELPAGVTERRTVARWAAEQSGLAAVLDAAKGAAGCLLAGLDDPPWLPQETLAEVRPLHAG